MAATLIGYSRAGDVFHYRWAARRCLRLIYPNASLSKIQVEGSLDKSKAGEDVIDLAEYETNKDGQKKVAYYQLKHTTVRQDDPFTISDLAQTFAGFGKKYHQQKIDHSEGNMPELSFTVITNRPIAESFKVNLTAVASNGEVDSRFRETIEKYTGLASDALVEFCRLVSLQDGEGNYQVQQESLKTELAQLTAGAVDNTFVESLVAMVQNQVLPDADGTITRERVLQRVGIHSERELYPALPAWDDPGPLIVRKQYTKLINDIIQLTHPAIVHATGGVGKSVFCHQLSASLPEGSVAIVYDCFGAGRYRNRSETRHRHRDALVQMANELAAKGLCGPLLPIGFPTEEDLMRKFLSLLKEAVTALQKIKTSGRLFLLVDAADNAEMAAKEYNQSCFAHELLGETIPAGCQLVMLCRTERVSLLHPKSYVSCIDLKAFDEDETGENLRQWFPGASQHDIIEFFRLTVGNPRVQSNALHGSYASVSALLASLGPAGTSVEEQIALQLQAAINKVKDTIPEVHHPQIEDICRGLASLPPNIPLEVLSRIAGVDIVHIKSFVSDIGRALWLSDTSVQFRDEPTETWFRNTFLSTQQDYETYIGILEPLSQRLSYVAEVLPQLYLQARQYDKLISIALSDEFLPVNHPIDARNIRVYRLQFAFKAALKTLKYKDAVLLAMRAGDEVAGSQRQLQLFKANVDLLISLQSQEKVQEMAFRRLLKSGWDGSENVYAASLLSGINAYHGEARGFLRAAVRWLVIYYENLAKNPNHHQEDAVSVGNKLEMAYAHLNLFGVEECVNFLQWFTSKRRIFDVVLLLSRRLIDAGRFDIIESFLECCTRDVYFTVAVTSELSRVGRFPAKHLAANCLELMCSRRARIQMPQQSFKNPLIPAIIAFTEACLYQQLDPRKITRVLRHYVLPEASPMVGDAHFSDERSLFLRALAIRKLLSGNLGVDLAEVAPRLLRQNNYETDRTAKEFKEVLDGMFPWYLLRARILRERDLQLLDVVGDVKEASTKARANRYLQSDVLPSEIAGICAEMLVLYHPATPVQASSFYKSYLLDNPAFGLDSQLALLRAAYRSTYLQGIRYEIEQSVRQAIKASSADGPDDQADRYVALARAVLVEAPEDARIYFNEGVGVVSKFGDEMVQRWEAVVSLAKKGGEAQDDAPEIAYRFIRCAEMVGENVAREKHWSRGEAVQTCAILSPRTALAAVSRWREADIESDDYLLAAVLSKFLKAKIISPEAGWALTQFFETGHKIWYLSSCIEHTADTVLRQKMLDDAVKRLQEEGADPETWRKLQEIVTRFQLSHSVLHPVTVTVHPSPTTNTGGLTVEDTAFWDDIFQGLVIDSADGLQTAMQRASAHTKDKNIYWSGNSVLQEAIKRLEVKHFRSFVDTLFLLPNVSRYDFQEVLKNIPAEWLDRPSFQKEWPDIIRRFGEHFAQDLSQQYSFDSLLRELALDKSLVRKLTDGMLAGFAEGDEFANDTVFFGFVHIATSYLSPQEATEALSYALSRFELHIAPSFGDGAWNERLLIQGDMASVIAGYIWAALGAPQSEVRWRAAHCVRALAAYGATQVLHALISFLPTDYAGAFERKGFIFYHRHARQYLLIAFARVARDHPEAIRHAGRVFLDYAKSSEQILIQKFALNITLQLQAAYPGTYTDAELERALQVGKSPFPLDTKKHGHNTDRYLHTGGNVSPKTSFYFGWDWENYWFSPLADVFGLSVGHVKDLVAGVVCEEWNMVGLDSFDADPRANIWNKHGRYSETSHDHGSYPRTDRFHFYACYHAMMVIAARLLAQIPLVFTRKYGTENPWDNWLEGHLLTRPDGLWLSDSRDALPTSRPAWISQHVSDAWQKDIQDEEFISCLQEKVDGDSWLTVAGSWKERKDGSSESFAVSSVFVPRPISNKLAKALANDKERYNYTLPAYDETEIKISSTTYQVQGWLTDNSDSKRLDEFDPYADGIDYPPIRPGESFITHFGLTQLDGGKAWSALASPAAVLRCLTWASFREDKDKEANQSGMLLRSDRKFLKQLCTALNSDLVLAVAIRRAKPYNRNDHEYTPPKHKMFLLSVEGVLNLIGSDH